ncbi:MAG: sulfite exporter TauE/SafE family protein [Hyphomicrobiales bacterium]|nr:sulfite exporter TauE/SafE family protein [Hyphomicrobiales bacterium]MDE2017682.1 sulfite exporter TauE/SafE family protein [Hyphomicrobiales bacterium]
MPAAAALPSLFFFVCAVPAVILLGLSKGGFTGMSILSVPLLTLAIPPVEAAAVMLPILIVQDVVSVWSFRHEWDARNLVTMIPGSLIGVGIGWLFAAHLSEAAVMILVGMIALGFVTLALWRHWRGRAQATAKPGAASGVFWGAAAGFTSFVCHQGAPPFQVQVMPQNLPPRIFAGTATMFFAITNWAKLLPYIILGQLNFTSLKTSFTLFPLAIAATFAGVWLVRRVDGERFYGLIYALTLVVGLVLIGQGLHDLRIV